MAKHLKIVLLGSIPKGDKARKAFKDWKKEYIRKIKKEVPDAVFLYGDLISDKEGPELVVGHDLWLIKHADIVLVNAPTKIGAGTAQEMVLAKAFTRPVVSVIPRGTHHRKSNLKFGGIVIKEWIHPFLYLTSDFVADSVEEAASWIKRRARDIRRRQIKDFSVFDKAIRRFQRNLPHVVRKYKDRGW